MSRQAQLGLFAVIALLLLFGIFYVITDFGTRHSGYRIGVRFASAAGLPTGAQVFFSGVSVGTVDQVQLLPDNTVDVILAIQPDINIPRDSKFLIQAPLTGSPNMIIVPPAIRVGSNAEASPPPSQILPKEVLPLAQQPIGLASPTIADLLAQGQGEVRRMDVMLASLENREPRLINGLQLALDNVDTMTGELKGTVASLSGTLDATMQQAGSNIVGMTQIMDATLTRNQYKIDTMLSSLDRTSVALSQSMDALRTMATDPRLRGNVLDTTQNIRDLTGHLAAITSDLQTITSNPQTQGQLRDTVAHLDATMQKANSLLGALGGQSHVYGVDVGATPYPIPRGKNQLPPPATGTPEPQGTPNAARLRAGLTHALSNLVAVQVRLGYLNGQSVTGPNPLLTADRGPQADLNAIVLPKGQMSGMIGANDIGGRTTYNVAGLKTFANGFKAGGGILYSQLGAMAGFDAGRLGAETRIYNLRRPTFDFYGNLNVTQWAKIFLGERDSTRPDRRTVFGLQLQF